MAWAVFRSVAVCSVLALLSHGAWAQAILLPSGLNGPQARTRDELDAFGLILEARNNREVASAAESYVEDHPDSEFVEHAALAAMHSYYDLGNLDRSRALAQVALKANPHSPDALLHSARLLIAPAAENSSNLAEARRLVEAGLTQLKSIKLPSSADSRSWLRTRNSFMAVGKSVLGWLSFREEKLDHAINCLQQAVALDPQGEYFYRLSLITAASTAANRNTSDSRKWALRAVEAGPDWIAALARQQLERTKTNLHGAR